MINNTNPKFMFYTDDSIVKRVDIDNKCFYLIGSGNTLTIVNVKDNTIAQYRILDPNTNRFIDIYTLEIYYKDDGNIDYISIGSSNRKRYISRNVDLNNLRKSDIIVTK